MNNEIKIIKIKKENGKEFDVDCVLDLDNRHIKKFYIKQETFFELFNIKSSFIFSDIDALNLVLYSDNTCFYCCNCIFGFNLDMNGNFSIFCNSIDYIISNTCDNYKELKATKFQINFELPRCIRNNYIEFNTEFNYSRNTRVSLKKEYRTKKPCLLILTISSQNQLSANSLSNLAYKVYELLMLYFGVGLEITSRKFYLNDLSMDFYSSIVDKYSYGVKNSVSFSNFVMIDKNSLNKNIIKKYILFEKETSLLNSIYLTIINSDIYREIKLNMILQCIEGFYRCIYDKKAKLTYKQILESVFIKNQYCKKILSNLDKRIITINGTNENIFLYKARNHRNYFSHLNINKRKNMFEKMQINYAYWKIVLVYRLLLLEYLGIIKLLFSSILLRFFYSEYSFH